MKKLLVILSLVLSTNAFAGILLEPYVGYNTGSSDQGTAASETDVTGMGYGARVGWTMPLVFVALDYSTASLTEKDIAGVESDFDGTNLGVVVGASLPVIRVWAGYNFSSKAKYDSGDEAEGNGMKLGLGFKLPVLPISFNAEYIMSTFDEANGAALTPEIEGKVLFVSVSAPFTF